MGVKTYALTTAARLSSYMEIATPTGTLLTAMEKMIDSVTSFIETYTSKRFQKTTYTKEEYDTEEADTLNLKHYPIVASASFLLERRSSLMNEDDWETVDSQYYFVDLELGIVKGAAGIPFSRTTRGYRATYTAGYDFDNVTKFLSDTDAGDVELAAWMLLETLWNKNIGGAGIASERIGDYSVTYTKALMQSEEAKDILNNYADMDQMSVVTPYQP